MFQSKRLWIFLLLPWLIFSCKKDSEKGNPEVPYFFEISLNGADTIKIQEGKGGYQNSFGNGSLSGTGGIHVERQSTSFQGGKFRTSIYFIKTFPATPNQSDIESIFSEGNYPFGKSHVSPFIDGMEILWVDSSGIEWWTSKGTQVGGDFTITKHETNSYDNFSPSVTSGNFNCVLFNGTGDSISANGSFLGRTVSY